MHAERESLATIATVLAVVFWLQRGSALLGAITVVPIALVVGLVFGGMYVLEMPLTFVTALLMSITIGLGVDYSIHVTDRFADELDAGHGLEAAMRRTVTGTGGALLGSMLTSGIAFATMLLHPSPQLRSFGGLVVLALGLSFLMSVSVLPSLLHLWATRAHSVSTPSTPTPAPGDD